MISSFNASNCSKLVETGLDLNETWPKKGLNWVDLNLYNNSGQWEYKKSDISYDQVELLPSGSIENSKKCTLKLSISKIKITLLKTKM